MTDKYPLYPDLQEGGEETVERLIEGFKETLTEAATEAISHLYTDVTPYIQSDAWSNFRTALLAGLTDYTGSREPHFEYDFKRIRQAIFAEHREAIVADLNKDLLEDIESLKEQLEREREFNRRYW